MEIEHLKIKNKFTNCKRCGKQIEQKYRPQGGGGIKMYCSSRCRSTDWAANNKNKIKKSSLKYDSKPENKLKKKLRQHEKKYWLRQTAEYRLYAHAKKRAIEKNLEFSINLDDIKIPEYCPLLGILLKKGKGVCSGNSPSLDKIDSIKGYTPDNIWVISHKANTSKSNLSLDELKILVKNLEKALIEKKTNNPMNTSSVPQPTHQN